MTAAIVGALWIFGSVPFGILVGKCIAGADRIEVRR